jgi:hypothetical protein
VLSPSATQGHAYIDFATSEALLAACQQLNGTELEGKSIMVAESYPQSLGTARGGHGGRGRADFAGRRGGFSGRRQGGGKVVFIRAVLGG